MPDEQALTLEQLDLSGPAHLVPDPVRLNWIRGEAWDLVRKYQGCTGPFCMGANLAIAVLHICDVKARGHQALTKKHEVVAFGMLYNMFLQEYFTAGETLSQAEFTQLIRGTLGG